MQTLVATLFLQGLPSVISLLQYSEIDYLGSRWYRASELCGIIHSKYTLAIDIWSIGCTFGELLTGKSLFLRISVVHQLDLMTDLIGTPSVDTIAWALSDSYFKNLSNFEMEHFTQSINWLEVEFERRRITKEDTCELIYKEIDYHPDMLRSSIIKIGICFQIVLSQIKPLTEQQLMAICKVKQATQEAEEALSQGLDELNQSL
ncbi:mitogen-activated protein kinase 9, partial [Tanacetum coccineum]